MAAIRNFAGRHPQITAWIVLAIGMVIILVISAREVGFTAGQWTALIVTTILLAGACVWIIGWGEDEEAEISEPPTSNFEQEVGAEAGEAEGTPEANLTQTGETERPD